MSITGSAKSAVYHPSHAYRSVQRSLPANHQPQTSRNSRAVFWAETGEHDKTIDLERSV
jgi:hypothetical protein